MWWSVPFASAADLLVPSGTYATIQSAVDAATPADRVVLDAIGFVESVDVSTPVTIVGQGLALTTVQANNTEVFVVHPGGELTLEDLTVTTAQTARCVDVDSARLDASRVRWSACGDGGENGGGLHADSASIVTLQHCEFDDNRANRAGHLYFWGTTLDVSDTSFTDGRGNSEGGVHIASAGSDVAFHRCLFRGNRAGTSGGALSFGGDALTLEDSTFDSNHATSNGGAIHAGSGGSIDLVGNLFVGNTAGSRAAALDLTGIPDLEAHRNRFCDNVGGSAGAVRLYDTGLGSRFTWTNNVFQGNEGSNGGGLYVTAARIRLENTTFVTNRAPSGGAVLLTSSAGGAVTLVNSIVFDTPQGSGVNVGTGTSTFAASYTDWFANLPGDYTGNGAFGTGSNASFVDPQLQTWTGDCLTDELWPVLGSPLLDAGDPAIQDLDGSLSELGAWGGPDPICALALSYADADGDGYGAGPPVRRDCTPPLGYSADDTDCDDGDPAVSGTRDWYPDVDQDGQGDASASPVQACTNPSPGTLVGDASDCDDGDAGTFLGGTEVCGGADEDCDGLVDDADPDVDPLGTTTFYLDGDGDGEGGAAVSACVLPFGAVLAGGDCDDGDPAVGTALGWYDDLDSDGYGAGSATVACTNPGGAVLVNGDCDDALDTVNPAAAEVCAPGDEDCDATEGDADPDVTDPSTWYLDGDDDGWGDGFAGLACAPAVGWVGVDGDCDDAVDSVHPGALEQCNGVDDDCDLQVDVGVLYSTWYEDLDHDGFGDDGTTTIDCLDPGPDWASLGGDCAPTDPDVFPGAPEHCDGVDEDCDTVPDDGAVDPGAWWPDGDGDTFGDETAAPVAACVAPPLHVGNPLDCDDGDADVSPADPEVQGNGLDDDCDPGTPDVPVIDTGDSGTTADTGGPTGHTGGSTGHTGGPTGHTDGSTGHTGGPTGDTGAPTGDTGDTGAPTGDTAADTAPTETDPAETDDPLRPLDGEPVDPGCGCASTGSASPLVLALLGLLGLRRRRA